jgi:hypothetical protein
MRLVYRLECDHDDYRQNRRLVRWKISDRFGQRNVHDLFSAVLTGMDEDAGLVRSQSLTGR